MKGKEPDERAARILRENQMDPGEYALKSQDDTTIRLYCYKTRDEIVIRKGDRPW